MRIAMTQTMTLHSGPGFIVVLVFASCLGCGFCPRSVVAADDLSPQPSPTVAALILKLKDGEASERNKAAAELGGLGEAAAPAIPALIDRLKNGDIWDRTAPAIALGRIGPLAAPAIPALIDALKSRNPTPVPAIIELGQIFMFDSTPKAAREALVCIGAPTIPALSKALESEDALTRVNAAWACWKLEKKTELVLPVLVTAWKDKSLYLQDQCIREDASQALAEIGQEEPERIVPIALSALKEDEGIASWATKILGIIGQNDQKALAELFALLEHPSEDVRSAASFDFLFAGRPAIPLLIEGLKSKNPILRQGSACALRWMNNEVAKSAVPALEQALNDDDAEVRRHATAALALIASK